jgi:integrase
MATKLTSIDIKRAPAPPKGSTTLFDSGVKGFGIRIFAPTKRNPDGARSFFLNYRVDGFERRYTIGEFPEWSVEAARKQAEDLRIEIRGGGDPASARRERREAATIADLIQRYVDDHLCKKAGAGTFRERDELRMLNRILDGLGPRRKVSEIHLGDMQALHAKLTKESGPVRANRILAIASKAFSLAAEARAGELKPWRDATQPNPCKGLKRNQEDPAERYFSEAEISAIVDGLAGASKGSAANCIRLIMLTGCRPAEAMKASWQEFDAEPGFWVKPSAHTKQRRVHRVPLGAAALELIDRLRKGRKNGPWLFPGNNPGQSLRSVVTVWRSTRQRATVIMWGESADPAVAGLVAKRRKELGREPSAKEVQLAAAVKKVALPPSLLGARCYDLRHSFASLGAASGQSLPLIGRLLGHTQPRTTQRYVHLADDPMREAAEQIGDKIASAVAAARKRRALSEPS